MLKKIMLCLDGSKFAESLLPYAAERARRFNSKIILFKVGESNLPSLVLLPPGVSGQATPIIADIPIENILRKNEERDKAYLKKVANLLKEGNLDTEAVWQRSGGDTISDAITSFASNNNIDLIMMAAHKRSFWKRFIYGSITESVIRKSAVPVLVVSPQAKTTHASTFVEMPQASLT